MPSNDVDNGVAEIHGMNTLTKIFAVCFLVTMMACQGSTPDVDDEGRVLSHGTPESAGFSAERLAQAVAIMKHAVDERRITGVQLLVARHARVVVHEALGLRDLDQQLPMEKNTLLRMASVSKTVVATGVLMLANQGRLNISDPVSKYLPGFSEGLSAKLTVRDLLRHTTGFPYTYDNYIGDITMESEEYPDAPSLRVEAIKIGKVGPELEPGTRCQYTNRGYTVLGGVLEVVAGQKLDDFLHEQLYSPLGMTDTSHDLYGVDPERLSLTYQRNGEQWDILPPETPPFARSTGGLVTTAWDYAKYTQMYLNNGQYGSDRFLQPEIVDEATSVQTECSHLYVGPELVRELGITPMWYYVRDRRARGIDLGYGLGWAVASNGVFTHGGFRGTFVLVDPEADMIILIFAQSRVGGTPGQDFIDAVYDAIQE
ncbi:serine hydrolase domain-containing protein [Acidobacteriota bacterium]